MESSEFAQHDPNEATAHARPGAPAELGVLQRDLVGSPDRLIALGGRPGGTPCLNKLNFSSARLGPWVLRGLVFRRIQQIACLFPFRTPSPLAALSDFA